ncbi:MAG: efflux RND transporter periplasmic adaptor subunit [Bacteroidaceae bacterium]|nr:efflux RND transporter periplasmic adaptor subunit [Bacteroidaceae bacterium]
MRTYKLIILGTMAAWMTACENANPEYDATGVFETTEVIVSAQGNGEIMQLAIEEGSEVSPNELLGHIDTIQLSLKRQQLTATLSATESRKLDVNKQLASIRQQIANLKTEQLRYEKLVKANAASQKQLDDINYNLEVLHKQLSATSEQIGSSNSSLSGQSAGIAAQVAQIDKQIEDCLITSPIKGIILSKYAEQGEFAIPGRALFKVGDISDIKLRAYVSAPQLTSLQIGQKVKVYADFGETDCKEYEGTVTWISAEAEFTPKTIQTRDERSNLVYAIKIAVKNDGMIKRGMYGNVKF